MDNGNHFYVCFFYVGEKSSFFILISFKLSHTREIFCFTSLNFIIFNKKYSCLVDEPKTLLRQSDI